MKKGKIISVQLTTAEAHCLLRTLALANDKDEDTDDNPMRTWVAQRILGKVCEVQPELMEALTTVAKENTGV